jgi:membrane-bound lytic murein transglycosylase A
MRAFFQITLLFFIVLSFLSSCHLPQPELETTEGLILVSEKKVPFIADDSNKDSLRVAIGRSIEYLRRLPEEAEFSYGSLRLSAKYLIESLYVLLDLTERMDDLHIFNRHLREYFDFYQSVGSDGRGKIIYTAYYEPVVDGSLIQTHKYKYPLYRAPDDLIQIDLALFHPKFTGQRIMARYSGGNVIPYFNREEIDRQHKLAHKGYEIAWLSDDIDRFFLQIQGSGRVRLRNGQFLNVHYAASNGRPYRSIGRLMIDNNVVSEDECSISAIKNYLKNHPGEIENIFNHNESYVFFEVVDKGPLGSTEVLLTSGRSIATDPLFFPKGAPAVIFTEKPIVQTNGKVEGWRRFSRLVMNQDAGGAIRGPGRVDLFWGTGKDAELSAGHMKQEGILYFLVKKRHKYYGMIK